MKEPEEQYNKFSLAAICDVFDDGKYGAVHCFPATKLFTGRSQGTWPKETRTNLEPPAVVSSS